MSDKLPAFHNLINFPEQLRNKYIISKAKIKSTPNEIQRMKFINFYAQLSQLIQQHLATHADATITKKMRDVLVGALLHEMEYIKNVEYKGHSPEKNHHWLHYFTQGGSSLYTIIKEDGLGLNHFNRLHNDKRLYFLNIFYQFLCVNFSQDKDLQASVHESLLQVKNREMARIHRVSRGLPTLSSLEETLSSLPEEYHAKVKKHQSKFSYFSTKHDPERLVQLDFLKFIHNSCEQEYGKNNNELVHNFSYMRTCNVQYGAILFVLLRIAAKYKLFSPEGNINQGSILFCELLSILNVKHLNKIDYEKRTCWLHALQEHFQLLNVNGKLPTEYQKYIKLLKDMISQQEIKKHSPGVCVTATNCVVRYTLGFAASQLTADLVLKAIGGTLASSAAGPIGLVLYLTGGTILVSQLGKLVTDKIIPQATADAYAWTLDRIGESLTNKTKDAIVFGFAIGKKGCLRDLLNDPRVSQEDKQAVKEYVETLLTLPDDIMSLQEKNHISYVWGEEIRLSDQMKILPRVELINNFKMAPA